MTFYYLKIRALNRAHVRVFAMHSGLLKVILATKFGFCKRFENLACNNLILYSRRNFAVQLTTSMLYYILQEETKICLH